MDDQSNSLFLLDNPMDENGTDLMAPPGLTVSDYIEVVYNLTAMLIGVPINLWALHGHVKALRTRPAHARLVWLGIHLTLSNLMVLLIHSLGTIIWILTYPEWLGGDFVCKIFKCLSVMSFHISSNVVVSIAVDMFHSLHAPLRSQIRDGQKRVRLFLIISWTLATVTAMPQLFVWGETDKLYPPNKMCAFLFWEETDFMRGYNFVHLLCVFYIPLLFILFCYLGSGYHVWKHLRLQSTLIQHEMEARKHSLGGGSTALTVSMVESASNGFHHHHHHRRQSNIHAAAILSAATHQYYQRRRSSNIERQTRTKVRLLRKSASVIGAYVLCWLPYQVFSVWQSFCDAECEASNFEIIANKLRWLEALMISCACINPFLYTFVRYRPPTISSANANDSPRRMSNNGDQCAMNRKNSVYTNNESNGGGKRDSFPGLGSQQHTQLLLPLHKSSCGVGVSERK